MSTDNEKTEWKEPFRKWLNDRVNKPMPKVAADLIVEAFQAGFEARLPSPITKKIDAWFKPPNEEKK